MKKLFIMIIAALPLMASAQTEQTSTEAQTEATSPVAQTAPIVKFGYFSYKHIIDAMPDKAIIEKNLADLKAKYDAEMQRSEDDFNAKYEEFLENQRLYDEPILHKRQAELQLLMQKNVEFKHEAARLLEQARTAAYKPLKDKIKAATAKVGAQEKLAFIINADGDALPYVDPMLCTDVTEQILNALK